MTRRGFTVIEVIVSMFVISILMVAAYSIYANFNESARISSAMERFENVNAKIGEALKRNVSYALILRDYIASPEEIENGNVATKYTDRSEYVLKAYDAVDFSDDMETYRLIPSLSGARERCERFWGIGKDDAYFSGSFYVALVGEEYSVSPDGVRFPYKTVTIVDFGPFYRNFKSLADAMDGKEKFVVDKLFSRSESGFHLRRTIDESDVDVVTAVKLLTGYQDEARALAEWREKRKYVLVRNHSLLDYVLELVDESVKRAERAVKNVEDWASTAAKINAYNTIIGGSNLDKDYFVTCSEGGSSGPNGCEITYGDPSSQQSGEMDVGRTYYPSLEPDFSMDEAVKSSKYGFFMCESDGSGGCDASKSVLYAMDYSRCYDEIYSDAQGENTLLSVQGAVRSDGINSEDSYVLNPGMRPILATAKKNPFGYPYYFSSAKSIVFQTYVSDSGGNFPDKYALFENNAPIKGVESRPPYTASILTVFPWFVGGYKETQGGSPVYSVKDPQGNVFGIYEIKMFAHVM